jgi:DnaK suppressor protein
MPDTDNIRERLLTLRDDLATRAGRIHGDLTREAGPVSADFAEQVSETENDEVLAGIGASTHDELRQVNRALARLDAGHYGDCAQCGEPIDTRRLQALPYADRCVRCASAPG